MDLSLLALFTQMLLLLHPLHLFEAASVEVEVGASFLTEELEAEVAAQQTSAICSDESAPRLQSGLVRTRVMTVKLSVGRSYGPIGSESEIESLTAVVHRKARRLG